jgi:two-component system sensor histidine kinase/response regulator
MSAGPTLTGSYDSRLVIMSVLIAICASYTALRLGSRTASTRGVTRFTWLLCGAISMGFGIWSMHYVGMLAFTLPVPILYDLPTVIVSLLAAMTASAIALFVVSREVVTTSPLLAGSLFMGSGILAMHYLGMEGMRVRAMCHYDPLLVAGSAVIAATGSFAALWLTYRFRSEGAHVSIWRILSAVAMGMAISAMHYTGMAAARFSPMNGPVDTSHTVNVTALGMTGIVIVTFLLLGFTIFSSIVDQRLAEHRALAEELYRSRQMLQSVLDSVPQRVFWQDRNQQYRGCNRAFALDAGLSSPEEIVGKTDAQLPWATELKAHSKVFQAAIEEGVPTLDAEVQMVGTDGSHRWLKASAVPLRDSQQHLWGGLGTYEDITNQKRAEEAIQRSNAALSEFAHVVSHDLRSPLRVVRSYAQLVVRRYGAQLEEPGRQLLRTIEDSAMHMDELTRALLAYATATEPEPGGQTSVSLEDVFERAVANLRLLMEEAHAEITHDPLPVIPGYSTQFVQVFQNLLANAIKYRNPERAPRLHVGVTRKPEGWVLCVRDNGMGISPENQQRIFAPLTRLHGPEIPGFGIGLATCRKVIEHHGGQMWVESQVGVGSTFYMRLPFEKNGKVAHNQEQLSPEGPENTNLPATVMKAEGRHS